MAANTSTKESLWSRHRIWIILAGIILFLPPLSLLFQMTADSNFCGSWCPRMFFAWRKGMSLNEFLTGFLRSYMGVTLVVGLFGIVVWRGFRAAFNAVSTASAPEFIGRDMSMPVRSCSSL